MSGIDRTGFHDMDLGESVGVWGGPRIRFVSLFPVRFPGEG
ncbi:hypothetical protein N9222_00275 [Pseudomonadales bacterium]|nr:hypothetical protein [Pseudomonadales bacterium]